MKRSVQAPAKLPFDWPAAQSAGQLARKPARRIGAVSSSHRLTTTSTSDRDSDAAEDLCPVSVEEQFVIDNESNDQASRVTSAKIGRTRWRTNLAEQPAIVGI
jgi:hypothetical protein